MNKMKKIGSIVSIILLIAAAVLKFAHGQNMLVAMIGCCVLCLPKVGVISVNGLDDVKKSL